MPWPGTESNGILAEAAATWFPSCYRRRATAPVWAHFKYYLKHKEKLLSERGTHIHSAGLANWCSGSLLFSPHCLCLGHPRRAHSLWRAKTQVGSGMGLLPTQKTPNLAWGGGRGDWKEEVWLCDGYNRGTESRESSSGWNGGKSRLNLTSCLASAGGFEQVLHQQKTKLLLCVSCTLLHPGFSEVLQTKTNAEEVAGYWSNLSLPWAATPFRQEGSVCFYICSINSYGERLLSATPQESLFVSLIAFCYCQPADRAAAREGRQHDIFASFSLISHFDLWMVTRSGD